MTTLSSLSRIALLALALAAGTARAAPAAPEPERRWTMGFAAELGASAGLLGANPFLFGAKIGTGVLARSPEGPSSRWMIWLDAGGTDWFRPARPEAARRVDRMFWIHPNLELARQLVRRPRLSGWVRAGPTVGRYTVDRRGETIWFPGVGVGAGLLLDPVRLGVSWFGQWRAATVAAPEGSSPDVRMTPLVLFTVGLEYLQPFPR